MRMATGKVVEGKIIVEGEPFEEGITVTVLAQESERAVLLSPEEETDLLEAIKEADAGDFVDGEQFLRELRGQR
jgi:hypothetical protein